MLSKPLLFTLLGLALMGHPAQAADDAEKKSADLKWAKGVAADFLAAATAGQGEQAESLADASLKAAFGDERERDPRFRDWLNNTFAIYGYGEAAFESEEIAPDRDEAAFTGQFKKTEPARMFAIRVIKNKETGVWRVNYCRIHGK